MTFKKKTNEQERLQTLKNTVSHTKIYFPAWLRNRLMSAGLEPV